jgi:c-di-GMP-binding flagellar brake protein YcgR
MGNQERRKSDRVRANITVFYKVHQPLAMRLVISGKEVESTMLDLSEGGLSMLTDFDLVMGTTLIIRFTLFSVGASVTFYGPVEIRGEIRHRDQHANRWRIGLCFTELSDKDKQEITKFITQARSGT